MQHFNPHPFYNQQVMSLKIGKDIVLPDFSPSAPGNWGKAVIQLCQQFDAAFLLREVRSSDPNAPKFQPLGSSSNQGTQSQSAMAQSPSSPKRSNTQSSLIQDVTPSEAGAKAPHHQAVMLPKQPSLSVLRLNRAITRP